MTTITTGTRIRTKITDSNEVDGRGIVTIPVGWIGRIADPLHVDAELGQMWEVVWDDDHAGNMGWCIWGERELECDAEILMPIKLTAVQIRALKQAAKRPDGRFYFDRRNDASEQKLLAAGYLRKDNLVLDPTERQKLDTHASSCLQLAAIAAEQGNYEQACRQAWDANTAYRRLAGDALYIGSHGRCAIAYQGSDQSCSLNCDCEHNCSCDQGGVR